MLTVNIATTHDPHVVIFKASSHPVPSSFSFSFCKPTTNCNLIQYPLILPQLTLALVFQMWYEPKAVCCLFQTSFFVTLDLVSESLSITGFSLLGENSLLTLLLD